MRFAGSAILQKSQAERLAAEYDGRPADKGDMLEALKQAHPERWAKIASASSIRKQRHEQRHGSLDRAADRDDRD
jgi:hypothetical protein